MIIGISGKIGSGKDTIGRIIQYLTLDSKEFSKTNADIIADMQHNWYVANKSKFQIKKFADTLKDMVCMLTGCTREQLENPEFKNKELGKEWWYWKLKVPHHAMSKTLIEIPKLFLSKEDALEYLQDVILYNESICEVFQIKLTPRLLLQLLGTECGRDIIHPNIWVNALMSKYKCDINLGFDVKWDLPLLENHVYKDANGKEHIAKYPNWIITDVRFPNELEAVKRYKGITIRVNREVKNTSEKWQEMYPDIMVLDPDGWNRDERFQFEWYEEKITLEQYINKVSRSTCKFKAIFPDYFNEKQHPSETALDNTTFDYVIDNNGTIEELIEKVKEILIKENLLCQ